MKSGKQKKKEIQAKRRAKLAVNDEYENIQPLPAGAVKANWSALDHNNTYGKLPYFYLDKLFNCRHCGKEALWKASQQQWWYEVAKGHIDSFAVACRACRTQKRKGIEEQKAHMEAMANKEPHPHEAFFKPDTENKRN